MKADFPSAASKQPPQLFGNKKKEDDGAWGEDWGKEPKLSAEELKDFDYNTTDLNKCTDDELKAHKAAMEHKYLANAVRPGDAGYKYDVRVKYEYDADQAEDNSWDEDDEEVIPDVKKATNAQFEEDFADVGGDDSDYFDDDFA